MIKRAMLPAKEDHKRQTDTREPVKITGLSPPAFSTPFPLRLFFSVFFLALVSLHRRVSRQNFYSFPTFPSFMKHPNRKIQTRPSVGNGRLFVFLSFSPFSRLLLLIGIPRIEMESLHSTYVFKRGEAFPPRLSRSMPTHCTFVSLV